MKKFLTVLLALSVVFTYTVGSAFATAGVAKTASADPTYTLAEVETAIYAQAQKNVKMLDTVKVNFLANYDANEVAINGITFSKTAVETEIDTVFNDIAAKINAVADAQKEAALNKASASEFVGYFTKAEKEGYEAAINTEYLKYDTASEVKDIVSKDTDSKYEKPLLTAEHAVQKAEVVALIDKVNMANYSDSVPSDADKTSKYYLNDTDAKAIGLPGEGYYSFQAQVKAIVDTAKEKLAESDIITTDDVAKIKEKLNNITEENVFYATHIGDKIKNIPTIQEEGWNKEDLATMISRITVAMKSYVAEQKAEEYATLTKTIRDLERKEAAGATLTTAEKKTLADAKENLSVLDSEFAAIEKTFEAKIANYDSTTAASFFTDGKIKADEIAREFKVNANVKALAAAKVAKVEELQKQADLYNQMVGVNGKPMYDKAAVAKALENALVAVYEADSVSAVIAIELEVQPLQDPVKAEMDYVINGLDKKVELGQKFYSAINSWKTTGYDDAKTEEVKNIIDATLTAVRAAKTVEAVDEAFLAGYTKYDAVPTLADRDTAQNKKEYTDKVAEYTTELKILIEAKAARYGNTFATDFGVNTRTLLNNLVGNARADKGLYEAYTVEEMKTIYDEAVNTVNNLSTKANLDAELAALNAEIAAVKLPVTKDAKDTILALNKKVKAFTKRAEVTGYNTSALRTALLNSLTEAIKTIDADEINEAVKVIMKDGKISLDEKAAVEAVVSLVDAYIENYNDEAIKAGNIEFVYNFDFKDLEKAAVESMIAKIDPTAVPLDIEAIKAAREAYDALGETTINTTMYQKLLSLEKLVDDYKAASVTSLKITASSVAKKGSITVKWAVKGDASGVEAFEIYKSTKKNKGFKKAFTTKTGDKRWYKNTASLKKGTRYYYKVRAIAHDSEGNKITSDWSNKAYRLAK